MLHLRLQAIVGPSSSSSTVPSFGSLSFYAEAPNISKIGLARRDSLMAIAAALTHRIRTLNLNDGRSLAGRADRLALVCLSVSTYIARDLEVARHFWLGQLVAYALSLMGHPECHGALRATMTTYIRGLAVSSFPSPFRFAKQTSPRPGCFAKSSIS